MYDSFFLQIFFQAGIKIRIYLTISAHKYIIGKKITDDFAANTTHCGTVKEFL